MSDHGESYKPAERRRMLAIARDALNQVLLTGDASPAVIDPAEQFLLDMRGCFVSLHHRHGRLRGCIGTFAADAPLHENIVRMSAAATRDPRFVYADPVVLAEINDLRVEISVLTPMVRIDDPLSMRIGVDGIYIKGHANGTPVGGCFLPQVACEQGWDAAETLSFCCAHKMGLHADAWREPAHRLECFVFQSIIIAEDEAHA